ncbi:ABC transporter permease [Streptomyces sp. NPDC051940]|uniref:ABC transporter permease n=1 Tax=Streptomyces sp. NPDC051940 TaxID=3155675 RepID=UPI0034227513
MFALAMRSIRQRPGRFAATLLSAFLGAAIIMTFYSLLDTAQGAGVDHVSAETLTTAATVTGGYGSFLIFFAVASTLTVTVRQRSAEMDLLRCTGATPAQIRWMVVGEAAVVALVGAALAIVPAMFGGRRLLVLFQDSGLVAESVEHAFGPLALMSGLYVTLLAAAGAALLAVRRATRRHTGHRRLRAWGGRSALVLGTLLAAASFAMGDAGPEAMAPPAYGAILLSVGFAVYSPTLLGRLLRAAARPLCATASGYLTVHGLRQRTAELTGVLMPLILFVGISTGTLYMQAIENDRVGGPVRTRDDQTVETLNFAFVGIIALFACVMLINTLYATTSYRSREFGQQRLAGATPGQVYAAAGLESVLLAVTGVLFGTLAALAGIIPFTIARTDRMLPGQSPLIWAAIAGIAVAATVGTTLATTRRVLRIPAVNAVAMTA